MKRSFATHYITGNLKHPISNPSVTLNNVSYYIMHFGAGGLRERVSERCVNCSCSFAPCPRQEQILRCTSGFAAALGTRRLGGEPSRVTPTQEILYGGLRELQDLDVKTEAHPRAIVSKSLFALQSASLGPVNEEAPSGRDWSPLSPPAGSYSWDAPCSTPIQHTDLLSHARE